MPFLVLSRRIVHVALLLSSLLVSLLLCALVIRLIRYPVFVFSAHISSQRDLQVGSMLFSVIFYYFYVDFVQLQCLVVFSSASETVSDPVCSFLARCVHSTFSALSLLCVFSFYSS